jgi:hypothetical protein
MGPGFRRDDETGKQANKMLEIEKTINHSDGEK